ncbi:MAG TPA: hypothetical protein VFY40_16260 [Blastocatellia bacterium]|nr:hypothetical protein [Blastocatellia bacterium]
MKVKEIMAANVTSCGPNATLVTAAGVMRGYPGKKAARQEIGN